MTNLFSCKISFLSFYCKTLFFPIDISPGFSHSRSSHFSFEHHSPVPHKNPLKLGCTSLSLLHPQNMSPHAEILSSPHFCYDDLLTWMFFHFFPGVFCAFPQTCSSFQWFSITYQNQLSLHSGCEFCVEYFRVWETIYITTNTAELCWQGWNYVEISFKKAKRSPKSYSASFSRGKKRILLLLLQFTVVAYKIPQIWQCIHHIYFKSIHNMLCFFPNHHQMQILLLEICPLNDLLCLNTFN